MSAALKYTTTTIFLICLVQISFYTQRHEFAILFATYAVFFATYLVVLNKTKSQIDLDFFIKLGFILRGVVVFSFPNLSDDIYRFLWDGHLINLGENPFSHPPQYYFENHLFLERLTPELFSKLNSPNYFSVYPTVCQAVFATATFLFPKSIYGAAVVIKLFLFACEAGTIVLVKRITFRRFQTFGKLSSTSMISPLIYALNPLIIIELIGNAHFEAAMIFFFILAVYLLHDNIPKVWNFRNVFSSATVFSLSIVSKMLPLMFLPLLFKKLGWQRSFQFWIAVGILTLILLAPLYNSLFFNNISKSLALYFVNFEFNASLFYVLKNIGMRVYDYDMIHQITPFLTGLVVLFILKKSFLDRTTASIDTFFEDCLWVISLYFACATTVHPWYAALPLACSVFTTWRFPLVWTFFIVLTYSGYTEGSSKHTENFTFLIIEYAVVYAFFMYEWSQKAKITKS